MTVLQPDESKLPAVPDLNAASFSKLSMAGGGRVPSPGSVSVTAFEAKAALKLLNASGLDPAELAKVNNIPVKDVAQLIVGEAKATGSGYLEIVEARIAEAAANGTPVFVQDLQSFAHGADRQLLRQLAERARIVMSNKIEEDQPSKAEIDAAAAVLARERVNLRQAGIVYGLLPERVAEYFARCLKGADARASVEAVLSEARTNLHPIF